MTEGFRMEFKIDRYPEYGVTFLGFSGPIDADGVVRLCGMLDRRDDGRWFSYCDPTVDATAMIVARIPQLKLAIASKQREIFGDAPQPNAIVYATKRGEELARFWRNYTLKGDVRPMTPALFPDFKAACAWLGLAGDACAKFKAEVLSMRRSATAANMHSATA